MCMRDMWDEFSLDLEKVLFKKLLYLIRKSDYDEPSETFLKVSGLSVYNKLRFIYDGILDQ